MINNKAKGYRSELIKVNEGVSKGGSFHFFLINPSPNLPPEAGQALPLNSKGRGVTV